MTAPRRAIFVRPSLGIGGAERLVVDAALALRARGWEVEFALNTFDPARTLPEVEHGGLSVSVPFRLPQRIAAGRLRLATTLFAQAQLLRRLRCGGAAPDLFVCDLVPHAAAWIRRRFPRSGVLVYCHFPDYGAARARGPYGLYRAAIGRLEGRGMLAAHRVLANSRYTAGAVRRAFPGLPEDRLAVAYPGVLPAAALAPEASRTFLCVGRFHPAKGLDLALNAFASFCSRPGGAPGWRLVFAGGYDRRMPESRAVVARLRARSAALGMADRVSLSFDPSPAELEALWAGAFALVHANPAEHFGIVLAEAMARGLPVLAVDAGGPREIVVDGITGALRPGRAVEFAAVLAAWAADPARAAALGRAGRERAAAEFSRERFGAAFAAQADAAVSAARTAPPSPPAGTRP